MLKRKQSIREWVLRKKPDFNPQLHTVALNGHLLDEKALDRVLLPLDEVKIKDKENEA